MLHLAAHRRVVLVNEHMTSQRCPTCRCTGLGARDRLVVNKANRTVTCQRCRMTANRDDVGSENIYIAFQHIVASGCRPPYLDGRLVRPWELATRVSPTGAVTVTVTVWRPLGRLPDMRDVAFTVWRSRAAPPLPTPPRCFRCRRWVTHSPCPAQAIWQLPRAALFEHRGYAAAGGAPRLLSS